MDQLSRPGLTPAAPDPAAALRRLSRASVLVIGDVMLDRSIHGEVTRVAQESPTSILREQREVATLGGAGNVVRHLTALGAATAFIAVVGDDPAGSDLTGLIGGQPNVEPWLLVEGGRTTTVKTRYFAAGRQLLRADREQTTPIGAKLAERILRIARDATAATGVTVLSDYGKGVLAGELPRQLVTAARQADRKLIVDPRGGPKGIDVSPYAGADLIMPDRQELAAATNMPTESEAEVIAAATTLRARYGFEAVLVTSPDSELTLIDSTGAQHYPAGVSAIDHLFGAGDRVAAIVAAALAARMDIAEATRLADALLWPIDADSEFAVLLEPGAAPTLPVTPPA